MTDITPISDKKVNDYKLNYIRWAKKLLEEHEINNKHNPMQQIQKIIISVPIEDKLKYALSTGKWNVNKKPENQIFNRLNYFHQHTTKEKVIEESLTKETDYNEPD